MESTSHIDEYSFDDFTLVKTKKEKDLDKKVQASGNKINNLSAVTNESDEIQENELKALVVNKIKNFPSIPLRAKNILIQFTEDNKIKEINELRTIRDSCLTITAKINLKHQDFKLLTSEEIDIKILPRNFCYFNIFSYSLKPHPGKSLPKFKCNGTKYHLVTEDIPQDQSVIKSSMEILNIENYLILQKKVTGGVNLGQFMETNFEISSYRRKEMQIELLRLIHEICGDYLFWTTMQDFDENVIYIDRKWIITNLCRFDCNVNRLEDNLTKLGKIIGIYDFRAIVNSIFWKCQNDCLFYKTCKKIIENLDFKF